MHFDMQKGEVLFMEQKNKPNENTKYSFLSIMDSSGYIKICNPDYITQRIVREEETKEPQNAYIHKNDIPNDAVTFESKQMSSGSRFVSVCLADGPVTITKFTASNKPYKTQSSALSIACAETCRDQLKQYNLPAKRTEQEKEQLKDAYLNAKKVYKNNSSNPSREITGEIVPGAPGTEQEFVKLINPDYINQKFNNQVEMQTYNFGNRYNLFAAMQNSDDSYTISEADSTLIKSGTDPYIYVNINEFDNNNISRSGNNVTVTTNKDSITALNCLNYNNLKDGYAAPFIKSKEVSTADIISTQKPEFVKFANIDAAINDYKESHVDEPEQHPYQSLEEFENSKAFIEMESRLLQHDAKRLFKTYGIDYADYDTTQPEQQAEKTKIIEHTQDKPETKQAEGFLIKAVSTKQGSVRVDNPDYYSKWLIPTKPPKDEKPFAYIPKSCLSAPDSTNPVTPEGVASFTPNGYPDGKGRTQGVLFVAGIIPVTKYGSDGKPYTVPMDAARIAEAASATRNRIMDTEKNANDFQWPTPTDNNKTIDDLPPVNTPDDNTPQNDIPDID